jgi:aspartate carbamoyltransferase regulatory subunit
MTEINLDDFCKEKECINYPHIKKLKSSFEIGKEQIRNMRIYCERICPGTAYQFYQWLKSKGLIQLTSDF